MEFISGDVCGHYLCAGHVDNWPSGITAEEQKEIIDKVEQIIDKVTETKWGGEALDIKLNGNNKNRLFLPLANDIITVTHVYISCIELDSSWYTWDVNSIYLDPCIADSMWGTNVIEDGDFYSWKVAAPTTDLYYWKETVVAPATINRDTAQVQVGNYCVRMDIPTPATQAGIEQDFSLYRNRSYRLAFKYLNSAAAKHAEFMLWNSVLNVSLQADGTWASGQVYIKLPNVLTWTDYSLDFTSHPDFANYRLYLGNWSAAGSSIYFDGVGILTAGIATIASDISEGLFPRGYNNIWVQGTMGESEAVPEAIKQAAVILVKWENDPTLYTYTGLKKSEKIGDYAYTNLATSEADILTGIAEADTFLRLYVKRKAILMAP
ncbi:hypothetical protein ES703_10558 [subsurface metagenome]